MFCVRCGTARGVQVYWLRSETHRDMAAWARALVQGSHNAVNYQREFSFRCLYQGRPCQLVVHLNRGFSLYECGYNSPSSQKTQLWQFPFDKLKGSADDGTRLLYLDFGDDGEIVSILGSFFITVIIHFQQFFYTLNSNLFLGAGLCPYNED